MSLVKSIADTPTIHQQRLLVERILSSMLFRRSSKLAMFLTFICEQQQMGKAAAINEQRIGTEVFGRGEGYHMGDDSIVRSQARLLRLRLQEYFATEGKDELIVLTIPKGSYVPAFHFREVRAELAVAIASHVSVQNPPESDTPASEPRWSKRRAWGGAGIVLVIVLVVLSVLRLHLMDNATAKLTPDQRFWTTIFDPKRTTIIVPADSSLILMDELNGNQIGLEDYINRHYRVVPPPPDLVGVWSVLTSTQYTNVVDLNLVSKLERMPEAVRSTVQTRYSRDVSINELKQNNVVLIGAARANPWVELFQPSRHYRVAHDEKTHYDVVYVRDPGPGEQESYGPVKGDPKLFVYGVVAYLPGLDHEGAALLVAGTGKPGIELAAEFLTGSQFGKFLRSIDTGGPIPHFEVLLSAEYLNGNAVQGAIVQYHLLPDAH